MENLIVGIDPGTTSAYAILNIEGEVVKVRSSRQFDLGTMISEVIEYGNPVIVGCDKNPAPGFVEKFAVKTGAKLVIPREDMKVNEKKSLAVNGYRNDHEMDALASAKNAYNEYKELIAKTKEMDEIILSKVLGGMSIAAALDSLEEEEPEEIRERVKVKVVRPEKELEELKKQISLLETKNAGLQEEVGELDKENKRLKKRIKGMPVKKVVREKESNLRKLAARLERREKQVRRQKDRIFELKKTIADSPGKVIMKKLENLSDKELDRKKWMNVRDGDVVLVEDPNIVGKAENIELIVVYKKKLSVKKNFTYIPANKLAYEETGDFGFVKREELTKHISAKETLKRIVTEYKTKRATNPSRRPL